MLDIYKDGQAIAYNTMMNAINNNKISHAYLFDSNGNPDVMDIVLSFVKSIVCLEYNDENNAIKVCKRIDVGNYLDVMVIEPDGLWIKKNQIIDLQNEFSKKAVEGRKKIYIIKSADKMNVQTANSILKFLEEPVDDIIAILIVDNINLVLPTILSRCQIIKLKKKKLSDSSNDNFHYLFNNGKCSDYDNDKISDIIECIINFICYIEKNGMDTMIYTKKLWHNNFKDREDNIMAVELMINFYCDVIKYIANKKIDFYCDKISDVCNIANSNSIESVAKKIEILDNVKNNLKKNLNINLVIDKMIIDMCGDY